MTAATPVAIDFDAYYRVKGYGGVAWHLLGYQQRWRETEPELVCEDVEHDHDDLCYLLNEPEQVEDRDWVQAVMVGDDTIHQIEVEDLTVLPREDFCGECGQIGCTHDGLERD